MFKFLKDLLEDNEKSLAISKANLDNYFQKINNNINSASELSEATFSLLKEIENYKSLCLLRNDLISITERTITWRDVLDFKRIVGTSSDAKKEANKLSYPFFLWNDLIYSSKLEGMIAVGTVSELE